MKKVSLAVFLISTVASASQAYALTEAQLNEACGPLPQVYKECGLVDDKCCAAALARAGTVGDCRLRAEMIEAQTPITLNPVPVSVETGTAP